HCPLAHLASFLILPPPTSTLFPYTTLFRSVLVHPYHLEYGTRAAGQLAVEGARVEVVEIQVAPVIPLGEPEHLASVPEYTPTDALDAALEPRILMFREERADRAGFGIGHAEGGVLVVARAGHECELRRVGAPVDVRPRGTTADDMVADGGPMRVGRHVEPHHS